MPRKAKENRLIEDKNKKSKEVKKIKDNSKASKVKKVPASKVKSKNTTSKAPTKKVSKPSKTKSTSKATSKVKNNTKNTSKTKSSAKTTSNSNSKKSVTRKSNNKAVVSTVEYYDLPYRYNQTVVKILAQTPKMLFIYWDISDNDRKTFIEKYGEEFFNITKPVLLIHNTTNNYTFEVEINDFANSWYLHINDTSCNYSIELGRRPIEFNEKINTDYIYVASSNIIETPNDHILFDNNQNMVYFKNTKTNIITKRKITSLSFLRNMSKIYDIYDLYKQIYKDEIILDNPSS